MVTVVEQCSTSLFDIRTCYEEPDNGILPMQKEVDRLQTYKNWPCKFMEPKLLAKAGFYYMNRDDIVRCAFCNIEIGQWERGDNAMVDHQRWSSGCPFVRGRSCGNIPVEIDSVPASTVGQDTCGRYGIEIRPNSVPEMGSLSNNGLNLNKLGVPPNRGPVYPDYSMLEHRLSSFAEWPRSMKQKADQLAAAGFFYNGKGDQTICFHCGGGLKDWEDHDNPWEQHAKWFSKCNFVWIQKGAEYISEVCSRQEEEEAVLSTGETAGVASENTATNTTTKASSTCVINPKTDSCSNAPSTSEVTTVIKPKEIETKEVASEDGKTVCKICYSKEVGVVFIPCGHIVACVDCAPALTTCAICRKPLEAMVRAFLS